MAESIFVDLVRKAGREAEFEIDSAGLGDWHVGQLPDRRTVAELKRRGIEWTSRARQVKTADFERFDLILAMDRANERELLRWGAPREKVRMMLSFDPAAVLDEVPDPYYGGPGEFVDTFDLLLPACKGLLDAR